MTELVRVTHGIWRPPAHLEALTGRVAAALAACPDRTVVAGRTAARLHGLWLPDDVDGPIEVIVHREISRPSARPGSRRGELRARRRMLPDDEVCWLDRVPVTTEARTWVDLAERLSTADLVAAGDSALRGSATTQELELLVRRGTHRRGIVRARAALPFLDARSRSRPESHLRYTLVSAGLPAPAVNEPICSATGEWLAVPDLSYDDVRLAIEYNGAVHASVEQMRRDITRELDVAFRGGWRTVTFGPAQVFSHPDHVVAVVRELRRELSRGRPAPS